MTAEKTWVGIDVSKATLDVFVHPQGTCFQVPNTPEGVQGLIEGLQTLESPLSIVESTGGLERTVVEGLHHAALPVAVANPRQVKGFATALGKAKTDKIDAQVIARFAHSVHLPPKLRLVRPRSI